MLLLDRQRQNMAFSRTSDMRSLDDLFTARRRLVRAFFFTGVLLPCIFSLAARLDNWSGVFHERDANNYSCAKFIQTVAITCAIQEVTLLSACILHAAYIAFDTLFPSFIYSW